VASKYHDLKLAQIAVTVKTGGHFDTVTRAIDRQIVYLKDEEKEDVEHRDRCQKQMADTAASLAAQGDLLTKTTTKIQRLESQEEEQQDALEKLKEEIKETKAEIANRSEEREEERAEYINNLQHDTEALRLMTDAKIQIEKFYKENKIGMSLVQSVSDAVEKKDYKAAPDAGFEDKNYEGGKDSTNTLLKMMGMVKKDMTDEIENSKAEEKENLALFEKDYSNLQDLLRTQKEKELSSTMALSDLQAEIESKKESKDDTEAEKSSTQSASDNLDGDCAWIKNTFHSRREQRKAEIDGLVQAKGLLAGVAP